MSATYQYELRVQCALRAGLLEVILEAAQPLLSEESIGVGYMLVLGYFGAVTYRMRQRLNKRSFWGGGGFQDSRSGEVGPPWTLGLVSSDENKILILKMEN